MEPSEKKPELFFTITTVNAELSFHAVTEKIRNVPSLKQACLPG